MKFREFVRKSGVNFHGPGRKALEINGVRKKQALCIAVGIALFFAYSAADTGSAFLKQGGVIERNGYGQGEKEGTVLVDGLSGDGTERRMTVSLGERQYGWNEAQEQFGRAFEEAKRSVLGENESLDKVSADLEFSSGLEEMGIGLKWEPENLDLIDSNGTIYLEHMDGEAEETALRLTLKAGEYEKEYRIPITLVKPDMTEEETNFLLLEQAVSKLDQEQRYEKELTLPKEISGRSLSYRNEPEYDRYLFLILGAAAAVLMELREASKDREEKKRRNTELLLDYSDIVSGLCVYLGAGFPVRKAWEQLAAEYEAGLGLPGGRKRAGYEEIRDCVRQMSQGTPELKAYAEFGRNCGLRSYRKLAGLMAQYVKNGSGSLRKSLEEEMEAAFEERKAAARRIGEETGTKLLIPLFMMLLVVMVMVSVPAFLAFGI